MIISCPSCATRYDMPASRFAAENTMVKCAACGHSWIEARAIEMTTIESRSLPVVIEPDRTPEHEVRRLVEAAREAEERFAAQRRQRRQRLASWGALAGTACLPFLMAMSFPEQVVRYAPASIAAYQAMGRDINIYGLDLRHIEMQHLVQDGTRVLTIKGEIANVSSGDRKIPSIRFGLSEPGGKEIYHWVLDSGSRPLKPGESTNFVTRVQAPPETAKSVQIRFAHADEIGSN